MIKVLSLIAFYLGLIATAGYGWFLNLIAVINLTPFIFTAKSIIGIGGIFVPPVGIIMGYFVW